MVYYWAVDRVYSHFNPFRLTTGLFLSELLSVKSCVIGCVLQVMWSGEVSALGGSLRLGKVPPRLCLFNLSFASMPTV